MEPAKTDTLVDDGGFEWFGEPAENTEPKVLPEEPPLEQLHEDEWAWLLVYKFYEWLKIVAQGNLPEDERHPEHWERAFAFVKANQDLPPEQWVGSMSWVIGKYVCLHKQLTEEQKAYLQDVASGEIYPDFPDPADEAEAHRGRGPLY